MAKRGPKPSGKAMTHAERQRRFMEKLKANQPGADDICLTVAGFERVALRALAAKWRTTEEKAAARLLKDAIRSEAKKLR
jgi:hypothetical protein